MNVPILLLAVTLFLLGAQLLGWFVVNGTVLGTLLVVTAVLLAIQALSVYSFTYAFPARKNKIVE